MLVEEQIQARQQRAAEAIKKILSRPHGRPFGDYQVLSSSGQEYRVAMRGPGLFHNYCSCPDFSRNTLGTCKHIESILERLRRRYRSQLARKQYERERASLSLLYGERLEVQLKLPGGPDTALEAVAAEYFDSSGLLLHEKYAEFASVLGKLRSADGAAVVYSDVLEHVERVNELDAGLAWESNQLRKIEEGKQIHQDLVKVPLFPYHLRGVLFAASRGRVVLADDMGLGKTVQAIAAATLLKRRHGIERVLVISPASVKYQWKTEIERFSDLSAQVIDGDKTRRNKRYAHPEFFNLINYELVTRDIEEIQAFEPDLIILDEAQRIRNWATNTARTVKQLKSRYAFVLTGTPLENKLEELYSVVEFVDGRALGPAFRFLHEHVETSDTGKLVGYRGLNQIRKQLEPVLLRRKRDEVLKQLPERTDQVFRVNLTKQQAEPYWEQNDILRKLMRKWERQRWLSDVDMRRITCCIQNMRMLCNSTFLFDKETNHSPKLQEFREIVRELAIEEQRKIVVFSEYERMTRLAGEELTKLGVEFVSLHGGVPTPKRGALMERFREDPKCMVFLSTDAGGVGLNLQAASAVINFEPPWNPARLEQRIGRVHRMGQAHPVQVVHMLTEGSIEMRVWQTVKLKKALFTGLFDATADEVSFESLGRSAMLKIVGEIMDDGSSAPSSSEAKPEPDAVPLAENDEADGSGRDDLAAPDQVTVEGNHSPSSQGSLSPVGTAPSTGDQTPLDRPLGGDIETAVAGLFDAGVKFLEAFANPPVHVAAHAVQHAPDERHPTGQGLFSDLVKQDPQTNRRVMEIPMPEDMDAARIEQAIEGLLRRLSGAI